MNCEKGIQILIQIYVFSCFLLQIQSFDFAKFVCVSMCVDPQALWALMR